MTLRVKLEIVPFGDEDKAYEIGRLGIFNKGALDYGYYEYGVIEIIEIGEKKAAGLYTESVTHLRDLGAWKLVARVLEKLVVPFSIP